MIFGCIVVGLLLQKGLKRCSHDAETCRNVQPWRCRREITPLIQGATVFYKVADGYRSMLHRSLMRYLALDLVSRHRLIKVCVGYGAT